MKSYICIACSLLVLAPGCRQDVSRSLNVPPDPAAVERDLRLVVLETACSRWFSEAGAMYLVRTPTNTNDFLKFDETMTKEQFIYQLCQPDIGIGQLRAETAESFVRENQKGVSLSMEALGNVDWLGVIPEVDFRNYSSGTRSNKEALATLQQDYPKAIGVAEISAFGWSNDRSEGVIYVGAHSMTGMGSGNFYALRRHGSQYAVDRLQAPSWITKTSGRDQSTIAVFPQRSPATVDRRLNFKRSKRTCP